MKPRRMLAIALIVLGMVLLIAVPESAGAPPNGAAAALIVIGLLVEIIGIALEHRR